SLSPHARVPCVHARSSAGGRDSRRALIAGTGSDRLSPRSDHGPRRAGLEEGFVRLLPARQPDLAAIAAIAVRVTIVASLLIARSGRFPVRRGASLLGRIMDDQGEGTPERLPSDIQFHRCIRWGRHGFYSPSPASARRSLQALLSREHVPA